MNSLYLLCHFPFVFMVKVGISQNVAKRQVYIDRSLRFGKTVYLCSVKVPASRRWEKAIHQLFFWCRTSWLGGSGKTEWFVFFPAVLVIPIVLFTRLLKWILLAVSLAFLWKHLN